MLRNERERIIEQIRQRIHNEFNKYSSQLDWAAVAAHKIYATYEIKRKETENENIKTKNGKVA